MALVPEPILARTGEDEEHLVDHVVAMKRECALARRHDGEHAAKASRADHRRDARDLGGELLALAEILQRNVGNIDDGFLRHSHGYPTLPSSETEISFCASTANSIGSCCSTSLTNPLTTSATASSAERPRWRQ